ncbi:type II toxin-antitoxin system VapC family toxin [Nocardia panacis]|uniref:Type II toxin-antitoxin system VapC family toxin n=1 Tax=Nocardia panacis TaxID=2340916 RepID=A0A3A4JY30_9NOCA|nr:type II toxin-antitoxin system VapC family toxin [Nocardia panacis]RJO75787.1 type II toxin-antitoxin system VapC family toxin [Nocardia panacis]
MIVDASALLAIIQDEPERSAFLDLIAAAPAPVISVVNHFEVAIKIDRAADPVLARHFAEFMRVSGIEVVPVSVEQAAVAREAYRDFGKGGGHPAQLNLGDCFAYALASTKRRPLLFKGNDFGHTDIKSAA